MTIETAKVMIVSQLESMTSFARRLDTGAEVFIPAHLSEKHGLETGQELVILMVPNTRSESVEWLMLKPASTEPQSTHAAVMTKWMEAEAKEIHEEQTRPLDERIYEFVADSGYTSTGEVTDAFQDEDYAIVCLRLQQLHEAGKLSCAQVFRTSFQKKASYRMWSPTPDGFLGSNHTHPM